MQQVLELVLPHVSDASTLVVCSLLSQECRQLTHDAVKLNLPSFILNCLSSGMKELQHLLWLCKTSGRAAVNTLEAGCAILHVLSGVRSQPGTAEVSRQTGLHITTDMFIYAMTETPWAQDVYNMERYLDLTGVDDIYKWTAFLTHPGQESEQEAWSRFRASIPHIIAPQLVVLLRIACRRSDTPPPVVKALLDHDKERIHLLHNGNPDGTQVRVGPDSASQCGKAPCAAPLQQQQKPGLTFLLEILELLVRKGDRLILELFCDTPLANTIGETLEGICDVPAQLASLSGAQRVSASCLATLMFHVLRTKNWRLAEPLLGLPNVKEIPSKRLCQLMLAAGKANRPGVMSSLFKLGGRQQLDSRHVINLIKAFIANPRLLQDEQSWDAAFENEVGQLKDLQPGKHLGPEGVLELLEYCTYYRQSHWTTVCRFQPAASQITDTPRFLRILRDIAALDPDNDPIEDLLCYAAEGHLPVMQQLSASDWFEVLCSGLQDSSYIPEGVLELPVVQDLSSEQVACVLKLCIKQDPEFVLYLLELPAAQELTPAVIADLLLHLLQSFRYEAWESLLALPDAKQVPLDMLQRILDAALDMGLASAVDTLLQYVPASAGLDCGLPSEWVVHSILAAADSGRYQDARKLAGHHSMHGLGPSNLVRLVVKLLRTSDNDRLNGEVLSLLLQDLQQLPAWQDVSVQDLLQLIQACLVSECEEHLAVVVACPAATLIDESTLLELLRGSCMRCDAAVWRELLQLPAGQRLAPAALACLLTECLAWDRCRLLGSYCYSKGEVVTGVVELLLQHPASLQLTAADVQGCVLEVLGQSGSWYVVRLLLQHPAGQQLSAEALTDMLYIVAEHHAGDAAYTQLLLQQPAAGSIGASSMCDLYVRVKEVGSKGSCLPAHVLDQLSAEQAKELLEQALQFGDADLCQQLSVLPSIADGADPELQLLVEVVRCCGFKLADQRP